MRLIMEEDYQKGGNAANAGNHKGSSGRDFYNHNGCDKSV